MATQYTHTSFATAKTQLALCLGDVDKVHWTDTELGLYIIEALRTWNSLTGHNRDRGVIPSAAGTAFYNLSTLLQSGTPEYLRAKTIVDRSVISEIEYHIMEQQGISAWAGTDQFTLDQIVRAIERRRNQFLADTACVITERSDYISGGYPGTLDYPDTVIGHRRAVWRTVDNRYYSLRPGDERAATTFARTWATAGIPRSYSVAATVPLRLRLMPPPTDPGTLESLVVASGATLDPTASSNTGVLMGIPDDLVWAVKYGALSDLFTASQSEDQSRANECEELYQLGVAIAASLPVVLYVELDGRPVIPTALSKTDSMLSGWQGKAQDTPTTLSIAGPDCIGLTPVPDSQGHSVLLDVVRNAVVPVADGDFLQVGREHLSSIIGLAQHIATLKLGGEDHSATQKFFQMFLLEAEKYSYRRAAVATMLRSLQGESLAESNSHQWERTPEPLPTERGGGAADETDVRSERNARRRRVRVQ